MQVTGEIFNSPLKLRDVEYKRAIFREGKSFTVPLKTLYNCHRCKRTDLKFTNKFVSLCKVKSWINRTVTSLKKETDEQ